MNEDVDFFSQAPTTAIADVAVMLNLNIIMEGIGPLEPLSPHHVAAPATTIRFAPAQDPEKPRISLYDELEEIPPASFLVIAAGGAPYGVLGVNGARVARRRGAAGAIVDGAARDVRAIRELGMPVWNRHVRSLAYTKRLEFLGRDLPVACGGVQVAPGDIVVADADGVAVIPRHRREEIRRLTEKVMAMEAEFDKGFERGESAKRLVELKKKLFASDS